MVKISLKQVVLLVFVVVVAVVLVWVGFVMFSEEADSRLLSDARNDVFLSTGEGSVGIIDLVNAKLDFVDDMLLVEFSVADSILALGQGEFAFFDVLVILETQEDIVCSYDVFVEVNSTGVFGVLFDVESELESVQDFVVEQNVLLFELDVGDLSSIDWIEWSVSSSYEEVLGDSLVLGAFDFMPDEGMHVTFLDEVVVDN